MELYLAPVKPQHNPVNGRFLKGHKPFNKGKKWADYMDMRKAEKVKKNLLLGSGNMNLGGHNKRKVIGIKDGKIIGCFESATKAADLLTLQRRNIGHCCEGKRAKCGGINWFYEADIIEWKTYLKD